MLTPNIITITDAVNLFLFSTAGALVVITIKGYPLQFNPLTHIFFFYICCSPQGGARVCVYWTESIYISSSLQSLQMARSRPARRSSFSQARISAVSGERWSWRGGEDGGVVGGGGDGDDGVGGAGGESGADRRSSSSQARIRVLSQSR